jgi:riboflavin transporter FmnP
MILLWIVSGVLIGLSVLAIVGNLWIAIRWYLFKKRASMIPFVGGVLGAAGLLLLPVIELRHFWWVPLVADLGCGPMLLAVAFEQMRKRIRG